MAKEQMKDLKEKGMCAPTEYDKMTMDRGVFKRISKILSKDEMP